MTRILRLALISAILLASGPAQAADHARSQSSKGDRRGGNDVSRQRRETVDFGLGTELEWKDAAAGVELQTFLDQRTDAELVRLDAAARLLLPTASGSDVASRFEPADFLPPNLNRAQALGTLHRALDGVSDADLASGAAKEQISANFLRLLGERQRTSTDTAAAAPADRALSAPGAELLSFRQAAGETASAPPVSVRPPVPSARQGTVSWRERWKELGKSFHQFLYGESVATGASIAMAIVIPAYAMANFGIAVGVAGQLINIGARVVGSRWGAHLVTRLRSRGITEKTLYVTNMVVQVVNVGAFVAAFFLLGAGHWGYAAAFLAQQVIHGLFNGSIDNMAANSIKPRLVGRDETLLERANFVSQAARAGASLAVGLLVTKVITGHIQPEIQILIYAALMLSSIVFFRKMQLHQEDPASEPATASASAPMIVGSASKLVWTDYLPVIATQFATTTFWTLFSSAFAVFVFGNAAYNGMSITSHLFGAALFSLVLAGYTKRISAFLPPRVAFAMLVGAQGAFLFSGLHGLWWLYIPSAFALGALIDINKGRWMAYYQSRVPQEEIGALSAWLGKWGMGLAVLPLVSVGAAKIAGADVLSILWWAAIATIAVQAGLWGLNAIGGRLGRKETNP